jgi:hypothetical protein
VQEVEKWKRVSDVIDFRLLVCQIKEIEWNFSHLKLRFGDEDGGGSNGGDGGRQRRGEDKPGAERLRAFPFFL